ncbi:MAG TPA: lysophospholipid acyltransferase family protein [Geobacteraceae bacterium]|nr:lysophospholipid acyltransferase family protein [Geobacteraceae bacterium]
MKQYRKKLADYLSGSIGAFVLHTFICMIYGTMRVSCVGAEIFKSFVDRQEGFIGAFWHGRMLLMPFAYPGNCMHVLISSHRDGEIIANVMKRFGFYLVRGSSRRGGYEAMREMLHLLKDNKHLGITPDGPKGPAEQLKPGVAEIARLSGKAVIPVTFSASSVIRATSWDRFMIPYPFSRGVLYIGEPVRYVKGEDMEEFRLRLETALKDVNDKADKIVGREK